MIRFLGGNRVHLLENGAEYFPALTAAVDAAAREVRLESYIFAADETGTAIAAALMRAAQRGVAVHLLIDGFGAKDYPAEALARLRAAGVEVLVFRPEQSRLRLRKHRLRRMHRKLAVIDGRIAFVGGINIVNDSRAPGQPPQLDYAVRIEGPLVAQIAKAMASLHRIVAWTQWKTRPREAVKDDPTPPPAGNVRAAFLQRSNLRHRRDIERAYLRAIGKARRDITIANAYFLPGRRFRKALIRAAQRGVRVRLLLQGYAEFRFVQYASRALYAQLLEAGIEIHEYQPAILHAKVAVVDGHWATVGSSNIDPTSLHLAREANVVIFDREFAQTLGARLDDAIARDARRITRVTWQRSGITTRWLAWLAYRGVRWLADLVGYGPEME